MAATEFMSPNDSSEVVIYQVSRGLNVPQLAKSYPQLAKCHIDMPGLGWIHQDLFRLDFSQGKIVTANFDFDRVAHRRKANQLHLCAHQQSHFHETRAAGWGDVDLGNRGAD